ncbi:MAG: BrnT family toxin [Candidatus Desantisbacteria bacterium]
MKLTFDWDEGKAKENIRKHKINFEEATMIFLDPLSTTMLDPDHSAEEQRYIDIGISDKNRVLVVGYTECSERIRIINCRKATPAERRHYEKSNN